MRGKVEELAAFLRGAGATVAETTPTLHDGYFHDYRTLLTAITTQARSREEREAESAQLADHDEPFARAMSAGLTLDAAGLFQLFNRRERARATWREFFTEWDILVCPSALDAAFPHQTGPLDGRTLSVDDRTVPYAMNMAYPMIPILPGQPATAFPAGLNADGLPLGLQAIGPYLEDRTTLRFAQLLEREWRGFEPPPDFR